MTSAKIDTPVPPLRGEREALIRWAGRIAARSRAQILGDWLKVAGTDSISSEEVDVAVAHAGRCADDFIDFAILAGEHPLALIGDSLFGLGGGADAARALINARIVARSAQLPSLKVPA